MSFGASTLFKVAVAYAAFCIISNIIGGIAIITVIMKGVFHAHC